MEQITLSGRVRVFLESVPFFKTASFGIWVGAGSRHEDAAEAGISHFIEHMMFKGSSAYSARQIAELGDRWGGHLNAYTSREYTCYYAHTLRAHVPEALDLLCSIVTGPRFDEADLEVERGVILDEIAMYEDSAEDLAADLLFAGVWPDDQLGSPILGTPESVSAMSATDLRRYMARRYTPGETVVAVCGSFDRDALLDTIRRYFDAPGVGECAEPPSEPSYWKSLLLRQKDFEQTALVLGLPGLPTGDPRRFALSVLSQIAGGGASSRLFQRLREELGLAYSVYSYTAQHRGAGLFNVALTVTPEAEQQALSEAVAILRGLRIITQNEVEHAKEQLSTSLIMSMEALSARAGHAARCALMEDKMLTEDDLLHSIEAVTHRGVTELAHTLLDFSNLSLAAVGRIRGEDFYRQLLDAAKDSK